VGPERATEILDAAALTVALWGDDFDFAELAASQPKPAWR
jgi:hypothetical protein